MAIGTATALAIGATAIGGAVSASSKSKAASKAADAQKQAGAENAAVQREIYGQNKNALAPFMQRGNAAGDQINALLGLGGAPANNNQPAQMQMPQQNAFSSYGGAPQGYTNTSQGMFNRGDIPANLGPFGGERGFNPTMPGMVGGFGGGTFTIGGKQRTWGGNGQPAQPAQTAGQAQNNAFDTFRNSTGYQFRLGEGMDALNSGYAGAGVIRSGAAMKDAVKYGQDFASNEFGNYMGYLGNQQGVGIAGASALAGVGQNYANSISANNNNTASAIGNAALVKGQNNPFASVLGSVGGGLMGLGG